MVPIKLVIIGDGAVGKTSLLITFSRGQFPPEKVPTVISQFSADLQVDGNQVDLSLSDTPSKSDLDQMRFQDYPGAQVILICFAIDSLESYENVVEKWADEARHYCPKVPVILVGNKKDLRRDAKTIQRLAKKRQMPITFEEGQEMAQSINAYSYLECSAKSNEGVAELFETAFRATFRHNKRNWRPCLVM